MKLHIGDIVVFKQGKEELAGREFAVSHVQTFSDGQEDEITLEECPMYTFDAHLFEVVRECAFKDKDRVALCSVFWNNEKKKFAVDEVTGTYHATSGVIEFDERTMDCYHVPLTKLGRFYDNETNGNDFDVVFCLAMDENVRKAKQVWLNVINERISETKQKLSELITSKKSIESMLA